MVGTQTLQYLLPEILLLGVATLIYVAGAFSKSRTAWNALAVLGFAFAALLLAEGERADPGGPLVRDALGSYVRWLAIVLGLAFSVLSSRVVPLLQSAEVMGSLVLAFVGLMLTAGSQELVMLFVGLELISIPTYVLLALGGKDTSAQEVATKYLLLSVLSSAVLLYGFSFLYGLAGSTQLDEIAAAVSRVMTEQAPQRPLAILALVLTVAGLAFRLAAVPFHYYAPDVYQGTNHVNAALLSVVPKLAGLVVLVRLALVAMPGLESFAWGLALMLALVTMTLGNVLALWQDQVRRMLAYSSIAHAGYMLIGLTVAAAARGGAEVPAALDGIGATLFYATLYALATVGTFAALLYLSDKDEQVDTIDELAGAGRTSPWGALALALFMFSLAGIPLLAGFWGKFALFAGALAVRSGSIRTPLEPWFLALAIVGVLNAAIAAAYYLRLVAVMYFRPAESERRGHGGAGAAIVMTVLAVAVLWMGVSPGGLWQQAREAAQLETPAVEAPSQAAQPVPGFPHVAPGERKLAAALADPQSAISRRPSLPVGSR